MAIDNTTEVKEIDLTKNNEFQQQLAELMWDFKELNIEPEGEPIDWMWEITLRPGKLEPIVLQGQDERMLYSAEYGSEEHNLLYDLTIVTGMIQRKLDSFEYSTPDNENQVLSLFFENKWTEQELQALDSVIDDSEFKDPIDRIVDLLDDPDACVSIRVHYANCIQILYFSELEHIESERITITEDGTELREVTLSVGDIDQQTYAARNLLEFELPKLIITDDDEAVEFDTALFATSLAYSEPEERIEKIAALAESEVYPHDINDIEEEEEDTTSVAKPLTVEQKKKRKAKNKQAKKQRKKQNCRKKKKTKRK